MCAVDDTGRYSVSPSTIAMMIALIKSIQIKFLNVKNFVKAYPDKVMA